MADHDNLLQSHRTTYRSFVKLAFGSTAAVAIALALMALFLL
jgi:hypothetical protein